MSRQFAVTTDTEARVNDALAHIPADQYDVWRDVGYAMHHATTTGELPGGRAMWDTWAQSCPEKYNLAAQDDFWRRADAERDGAITLGTVFHLAEHAAERPPELSAGDVEANRRAFAGERLALSQLEVASPDGRPWAGSAAGHTQAFCAALFADGEFVNVVTRFELIKEKAKPSGNGRTSTPSAVVPIASDAGAWVRINPVTAAPGPVTDDRITAFRHRLVEMDSGDLTTQAAFLAKLATLLPVATISTSGGRSLHAVVRVNATNRDDYKRIACEVYDLLQPFGVDHKNSNPSRLSRLPGVVRKIGADNLTGGAQRLLWCNPSPKPFSLDALRAHLVGVSMQRTKVEVIHEPALLEEPSEVDPVGQLPRWNEVQAAIQGSPIEVYAREVAKCGDLPPEFALVDGILLGCLMLSQHDRRIGVAHDHAPRRCNAYVLHLAGSGQGKGFAADVLTHLSDRAGVYRLRGRSQAYVAQHCKESGTPYCARFGLYRISEIKSILSPRDVVGSALATMFLQAYDEAVLEWSTAPAGKPKTVLVEPFAPSLLLEGQPDLIESTVGSTNLDAGFLARFLVAAPPPAGTARKFRGIDADAVLAAYGFGAGPVIIRGDLPETRGSQCASLMPAAARSAWSRLHGDYLPRIAAIIDPSATAEGRMEPSALERAGVVADWFLRGAYALQGRVHGDRIAMQIARFERAVAECPGLRERDLYRSLHLDVRTFKLVADTAVARERVRFDGAGRQRRWYPITAGSVTVTGDSREAGDTFVQSGIDKVVVSLDQTKAQKADIFKRDTGESISTSGQSPTPSISQCQPACDLSQPAGDVTGDNDFSTPGSLRTEVSEVAVEKDQLGHKDNPVARCHALFPGQTVWVYDTETYPDFFLAVFTDGEQVLEFDDHQLPELKRFLTDQSKVLVGFNNYRFDDALLKFICNGLRMPIGSQPAAVIPASARRADLIQSD